MISAIRTARSEMNVPAASELAAYLAIDDATRRRISHHQEQIRRLARLKELTPATGSQLQALNGKSVQVLVEGGTVFLDVADTVDLAKERARLAKEAAAIDAEIGKIASKLENQQFLARAKPEVVEEQRERLAEAQTALERVRTALSRISVS